MKGYYTDTGYRGYMPNLGVYLFFATETDYVEAYWNATETEE